MPLTPWDSLATELVFDHRWYRLRRDTVRLPSGKVVDDYFVSVRPDNTAVFAVTPAEEVVFVRQWKQGRREFLTELPGGMVDAGEEALACAARELREETGYACDGLRELGRFEQDPTKATNRIVAVLGTGAHVAGSPVWDEQEELEVRLLPLGGLHDAIRRREITSVGSVAAVYLALSELGQLGVT